MVEAGPEPDSFEGECDGDNAEEEEGVHDPSATGDEGCCCVEECLHWWDDRGRAGIFSFQLIVLVVGVVGGWGLSMMVVICGFGGNLNRE